MPNWVAEGSRRTATLYSEEELDQLVDGMWEAVRDMAVWEDLVARVGEEEARRVLRTRIIMEDKNAGKQTRH